MRDETQTINFETENSGDWNVWKYLEQKLKIGKEMMSLMKMTCVYLFIFLFTLMNKNLLPNPTNM